MSTTTTLTRSALIDETLEILYRSSERPRPVVVGTNDLVDATDSTLTLASGDDTLVYETNVLEWGQELLLVTNKSSDTTPIFTVSRGYAGTTASAGASTNSVLLLNPQWSRTHVDRALGHFFDGPANTWLPYITSSVVNAVTDKYYASLSAATMRVLEVRYQVTTSGRIVRLDNVQFHQDIPTSVIATGKALRVPEGVDETDDLWVTAQEAYAWTGSGESATISVPVGSVDLAPLYAAAYVVANREVTRTDLDKVEEWNQDAAIRAGANVRLIRELWANFYRRLDEARRLHHVPKRREFRKRTVV